MNWAHLLLQANIYLVVFYAFYKLLLDKETYFVLNRIYLLTAGILSMGLPFVRVSWFVDQPATQPVYQGLEHLNQLMTEMTTAAPASEFFSTGQIVALIYIIGVAAFTLKFFYQLLRINRLLKGNAIGSAFSFFNKKVIDPALPDLATIEHHEDVHSRQLHSFDVLFSEILGILNWFNPVVYFYKNSLKSIHEYLADEQAAQYLGDKQQYALLLVSNAFGVPVHALTNSFFNEPLLKKRIFMLHQKKSTKTALLKYGLFAPLFGLGLMLSSATLADNEELKEVSAAVPLENPLSFAEVVSFRQDGWKDFYTYLNRTTAYPSAAGKPVQGSTTIRFTIKDGNVEDIGVAGKRIGSGTEYDLMKNILSYKKFDQVKDGKYALNVSFKTDGTASVQAEPVKLAGYTQLNPVTIIASERVYSFTDLDKAPSFPGGFNKFYEYLGANIKYPAEAKANNVNGKVFLSFTVETDGGISDINVDRKLGMGTDEEAVRVISASPKWVPGIKDGKPVRVRYSIPISFMNKSKADSATVQVKSLNGKESGSLTVTSLKRNGPEPVYYVDGIKSAVSALESISPNEIASVNVIKGESATKAYGEEGKNGVILIITKKAAAEKATVQ